MRDVAEPSRHQYSGLVLEGVDQALLCRKRRHRTVKLHQVYCLMQRRPPMAAPALPYSRRSPYEYHCLPVTVLTYLHH